jgi:hypothetical protein
MILGARYLLPVLGRVYMILDAIFRMANADTSNRADEYLRDDALLSQNFFMRTGMSATQHQTHARAETTLRKDLARLD